MSGYSHLPLTSNHWGTHRVETVDGKVKALHPFEQDVDPSPIAQGILDVMDAPSRIKAPMVRRSYLEFGPGIHNEQRGADPFVQVSWDVAEQLVADELNRVRHTFGNASIYAGCYGWASAGRFHHAQSQIKRFLNCIGGFTRSLDTYSFAAGEVLLPHILGSLPHALAFGNSWESVINHSKLVVAFGGIPVRNGQINSGGVGRHIQRENILAAKQAGVDFVNISPLRNDIEDHINAEWLSPRPGTDTAILLGMAHTLYNEGLHDAEFLARYTHGFDKFVPYLTGEYDGVVKNAAWAASISALNADDIRQLARQMAAKRSMLSVAWALTRQDHGEQTYWAAVTVAAMLGQMGLPGGGITFGFSATNSVGGNGAIIPAASLPQGKRPIDSHIPVARISDMLLHPGEEYDYNGQRLTYPDTKVIYWGGGNPFHHHQDLNRLLKAWRKPDSIIVHEWCWNALAKHADIVLPCTVPLERNDIAFSPRDPYVVDMQKATEPQGDARNDYDILSGIAAKMGVTESFTEGRSEADWLDWIYRQTQMQAAAHDIHLPNYAELKQRRWFLPDPPAQPKVFIKEFRQDPKANPLKTATGKIEIYSPTIASFNYDDCPGHPVWQEPIEWLGGDTSHYPLHLISNQPATKLHSQLDHGKHSRASKIQGREPIRLHPDDAAQRGLTTGDVVRIFNDRGACLGGVVIDEQVMRSVVQMSTGAWFDPLESGKPGSLCKHGNPNMLTPDKGTSKLSQGPVAHSCLVEVELFTDELPEVTAFEPPVIIVASD